VIGILQKLMAILIGSFLISLGINLFLVPHHLLDGGIIGIALILHYYFDLQTGVCMIMLSIPIFIYAWFYGRNYFYNSFHGLMVSSVFIDWLAPLQSQFSLSIFSSALLGGTIIGLGIGLMLRYQTSTGGTDLIAQFISNATSLNVGIIILIVDGFVVAAGYQALGLKSFLFSCLTISTVGTITSMIVKK
jgi:uncharacterized membrane-anchored protein YitT (DUF2179 family)